MSGRGVTEIDAFSSLFCGGIGKQYFSSRALSISAYQIPAFCMNFHSRQLTTESADYFFENCCGSSFGSGRDALKNMAAIFTNGISMQHCFKTDRTLLARSQQIDADDA